MDNKKQEKLFLIALRATIMAGIEIVKVYEQFDFKIEYKADNSPLTLADKNAHNAIVEILNETGIPVISEEGKHIAFEIRKNWKYSWLVDPLDGTKEFIKRNGEFTVNIALLDEGKPILGLIYAPILRDIYFAVNKKAYVYRNVDLGLKIDDIESNIVADKIKLPNSDNRKNFVIIASRSHLSEETRAYIEEISLKHQNIEISSIGSSLKFCMIAAGNADLYPRFAPTMEWDTGAGQAIIEAAGGKVTNVVTGEALFYNKEDLLNPWFIAKL